MTIRDEASALTRLAILALIGLAAMLVAMLASCIHLPHVDPKPRGHHKQELAAVRVEMFCFEEDPFEAVIQQTPGIAFGMSVGSGVIVDDRHVITAFHVTTCPLLPTVNVVLSDGRRFRMLVDKENEDADLSRLVMASADRFHLPVAPPTIAAATDTLCTVVAYPKREWNCGKVTKVRGHNARSDIEVGGVVVHGNSGAGAYDSSGRLVGIVSQGNETGVGGGITSLSKHMEMMS